MRFLGNFFLELRSRCHFYVYRVLCPAAVLCECLKDAFVPPLLFYIARAALLLLKRERMVGFYVLVLLGGRVLL
jgi:hypothetical protein